MLCWLLVLLLATWDAALIGVVRSGHLRVVHRVRISGNLIASVLNAVLVLFGHLLERELGLAARDARGLLRLEGGRRAR